MSFAWQELAELAIWLAAERPDEAGQRTAISRAYYAAYHAASAYVRAHELAPPSQHLSHHRVWRLLRDSGRTHSVDLAELCFELKNTRVAADYWNPFPGDLVIEVDRAIATSVTIMTLLREM